MPTFAVNNAFIFSPSPLGDTRSCHIRLFPSFTVSTFTRATAKQSTCTCPKEPTPAYGHPSKEGSRTHPLSGKEPTPAYGHPSKEGSRTYPLSGGVPRQRRGGLPPARPPSTSSGPPPSTGLRTGLQGGNYILGLIFISEARKGINVAFSSLFSLNLAVLSLLLTNR